VAAAVDVFRRADAVLDRALTDQESRALDLLYRRYATVVTRVAGAIVRNLADAEDVTQDVFLDLPRALRRYEPGNFEGWLKTVAARTALMRLRRQTREQDVRTSFGVDTDEMCPSEGDVRADSDRVQRAVQRLPESLRHVVELRLLRGLPHAEIGLRLGLSSNACEVRLCRALKQLRVIVGEAA
jgi:RNA polymerase sigma-70 factor (ECF subfamily)